MVGRIRILESKNDKCWMFSIEASPVALKSFMEIKGYKYVQVTDPAQYPSNQAKIERKTSIFDCF